MEFHGELIVHNSTDPECDAARVLLERGCTGQLTILDGVTGKPRLILDIERAAKLTAWETRRERPMLTKYRPSVFNGRE